MTKVKVVPKNVLNPNLYRRAHARVTETYGPKSSAYRSMAIVKTYKAMGGKYRRRRTTEDPAKAKAKGVSRWLRERWIAVLPYLLDAKVVECGALRGAPHACRPLRRVSRRTPMTVDELVLVHGKAAVLALAKSKRSDMSARVDWRRGVVTFKNRNRRSD